MLASVENPDRYAAGWGEPHGWRGSRGCRQSVGDRYRACSAEGTVNKKIPNRGDPLGSTGAPPPEYCRAFLDRYSDYRDGRLGDEERSFFAGHMAVCGPCRRYDHVIRKGVDALRKTPPGSPRRNLSVAEVRRLATAVERQSLALGTAGSGVTLVAAVLVAVLMAAVAWSPFFSGHTPEVRLPPVVAGAPPPPVAAAFTPPGTVPPTELWRDEVGDIIQSMLFEFGPGRAREADADPDPD